MSLLYLPGAVWRPVSYRADAGKFTTPPLGYIVHVVVGNGSPWRTFQTALSPSRRFSHGWVAKDGTSEQYQTLDMVSWAQAAGNGQYWSFETEGYPSEPLTGPQINTLASWHNFVNAPDTLANAPGQHGSGTHYMGGTAWGGHTCPDASAGLPGPRSKQRAAIIARAVTLRTPLEIDVPLTPAEITAITVGSAEQTWQRFTVNGQTLTQVLSTLLAASDPAAEAAAIAAAVVKALPASGTAVTAAQIAKAVADEQARRLVA